MELKIYNKTGDLILTASPNSSSSLMEEIGGECCVSVSFTHTSFVLLDVDNYIEVLGVRYKIKRQYRPKQKNTQTYEYSVKFYAPIHDAEDVLMLFSEGDTTSEFNYDGGPREHLQLWVDNMNRLAGKDVWSIGTVISAENKNIEYKNLNCWDAAFSSNGIAATFDTEMWADGFVINLCKASHGERQELGYMQGLTNLSQEDNGEVKFFTRLFPLGSTRNIDASKYGYSRLQLPSRAKYVDKNVDLYGVKEETEEAAFSAIYPKYVGTISSVRTEEKENEEGRKYTVYYFKDNSMSFNPDDYQIPEYTYMLEFQTGELAGRGTDGSFQAAWHENTKEWEIINVYPDDTTQIPGGVIIPKPGDQYIPWNFSLPQEYTTAAEQAYELAVNNFLSNYNFDPNKYTGTTDRNYVERNNTPLRIGQNVRLLSDNYFTDGYKDTRIIKVQRKLNDLYQATITCSDEVGTGWKSSVDNRLNNLQYVLSKQEQQAIIDIIKTTDSKSPSDSNVYSALRSIAMFLRKDKQDDTRYLLRMLAGAHFYEYTQGMIGGSGAAFYKNPDTGKVYMEADGAYLREELVVPKITFNCIDVISGDKANTFAYGTIKSVDKQNMIAELDLLEDERGTLHVDDICRGVFHNIEGENDTEDMEDDNGFYHYSGFSTSYFSPVEILENALGKMKFRYVLQVGTSVHPMPGMNFFAYGNFRDKARQAITYETRYYTRRLKNVDTWTINPTKNISMQDGLLDGLVIGGMVMTGYGTFQENCYFTGVNIQFTPDQEEAIKGESAYSVSLSSYERVVKMDADGNIVSLLKELNVISNLNNVTTGDKNVITTQPKIQTYIQVAKGTEPLLYSDIVEKGKYIVTITEHGCKASVENGILSIEKITGKDNCYVDLLINCEGNITFEKTFSVSIIRDGSSNIVVDLDNEMASVVSDADGKVIAGLPLETNVSVYLGSEKQEITNIELDTPSGVTASSDASTGKITITEIADSVPESIEIAIKVYFSHDNIAESRVVKFNVAKVKGGENAVIYQLSPSVTAIKVNKEGEYDHGTVSCYINMINGEKITTLDKTPSGLSMRYEIDNNIENEYTYGNSISINEVQDSIKFKLYKEDVLIDQETIPIVRDGVDGLDGAGSIVIDMDNEMASVACDAEGSVVSGLPVTTTLSMFYGTEKLSIKSYNINYKDSNVVASFNMQTGLLSVTSIGKDAPDNIKVTIELTASYEGKDYTRETTFIIIKVKPGANGENAILYQLAPTANVVKVSKTGSITPSMLQCYVNKTDGNNVTKLSVLPSGYTMKYRKDNESDILYTYGSTVFTSGNSISITFKLYKGEVLIDQETIPVVKDGEDGLDGAGSIVIDMDNEMASVACDAEGNVVSGLPVTTTLSMFYGTEKLSINEYVIKYKDNYVTASFNLTSGLLSVTSIGKDAPDNMKVTIELTATYNSKEYKRTATFSIVKVKPGANGENAILYQLKPSSNVVKVSKSNSYSPASIRCYVNKTDGNNVSELSSLPSGYVIKYIKDNGSELTYSYGQYISTTENTISIKFKLYKGSVLIDQETIPIVKDGADGADGTDGNDGADGAQGKQGIQGCVIRSSLWAQGVSYVNQSELDTDGIRYIDVALIENSNYDTGYEAYICKVSHTSSSSNKPGTSSYYWEAVGSNVSSIFANTVIAKNASFKFSQSGQMLLMDSNKVMAGASGGRYSFWAGAEQPYDAPFYVTSDGFIKALQGTFKGFITAKSIILEKITSSTEINGAVAVVGLDDSFLEYLTLPELYDSQVQTIDIIGHMYSRTLSPFTLKGQNSRVLLTPDLKILDAVNTINLPNIQGCYFKAIGYISDEKTYWSIIPMNEAARNSIS